MNEADLLRSLWQTSREDQDRSVFEFWDEKKLRARKEVMDHLVEMMSSVKCPAQGESSSNLYRILVKKLRGQIANFHEDPEVSDKATRKIAKWIEGLVKEAYYRKQGKIKPRVPESEYRNNIKDKKEIIEEANIDPQKLYRDQMDKIKQKEKELLKEMGEVMKLHPARDADIEIEEKTKAKAADQKKKVRPTVKIDGVEYVLKKVDSDGEEEEDEDDEKSQKDHLLKKLGNEPKEKELFKEKKPKKAVQIDDKIKLGGMIPTEGNYEEESQIIIDRNKRVVLVKPFKKYLIDRNILLVEDIDPEAEAKKKPAHKEQNSSQQSRTVSSKPDLLGTDIDVTSATPLIRNWSGWMLNMTKKAKDLMSWENSRVEHNLTADQSGVTDQQSNTAVQGSISSKEGLHEDKSDQQSLPSTSGSSGEVKTISDGSPRRENSSGGGIYTYFKPRR